VIEVGTELLGGRRPGGRSTSTAVAAARAWSLSSASPRWADVGVSRGRIDLGRADEDVRTFVEEAAPFGL